MFKPSKLRTAICCACIGLPLSAIAQSDSPDAQEEKKEWRIEGGEEEAATWTGVPN